MTYGILIYDKAHLFSGDENTEPLFDSVDINHQFWQNDMLGYNIGRNGQKVRNYGSKNVVAVVIVKAEIWTQEMTDAINDSASEWNIENPNNRLDLPKLIYQENETNEIFTNINARILEVETKYKIKKDK